MSSLSISTGVVLIDSRSASGTITLPPTIENLGRNIVFKDAFSSFHTNPVTLSTNGIDTFEDGANLRTIQQKSGIINLIAGNGIWYQVGGTSNIEMNIESLSTQTATIQSLTVSSINTPIKTISTTQFVITSTLQYSYNGTDWNQTPSVSYLSNFIPRDITYSSSLKTYLTIGDSQPPNIATSSNGNDWIFASSGFGNIGGGNGRKINADGPVFVAIGQQLNGSGYPEPSYYVQNSINGIDWNPSATPVDSLFFPYSISYVSTNFYLVGGVSLTNPPISNIYFSSDASNWTSVSSTITDEVFDIGGNGSIYIAVGYSYNSNDTTSTISYSMDGSTWHAVNQGGFDSMKEVTNPYGGNYFAFVEGAIGWNGNLWVATGNHTVSNSNIQWSSDGSNWYGANNTYGPGYKVKWFDSSWYIIGSNGIQTSKDGSNWSLLTSKNGYSIVATTVDIPEPSSNISRNQLVSTINGLGSAGYLSTIPEAIVLSSINVYSISTVELTVTGASTLTVTGNVALFQETTVNRLFASSITNESTIQFIDQINGNQYPIYARNDSLYFNSNLLVPSQGVTSTVTGLGSAGYISSLDNFIPSTVTGLGSSGYISSLDNFIPSTVTGLATAGYISSLVNVQNVSSMAIQCHSICTLQTIAGAMYYSYAFL